MLLAKIAFTHYEGYKVHSACAVSRDLCIWDPKTTCNHFLTPHENFQSKLVPKMAVIGEYKGLNIKYSHRDPAKALVYLERRLLAYCA